MEALAEDEKQPPSLEVGAFNLEEHSSNMVGHGQGADRIITETLQERSSIPVEVNSNGCIAAFVKELDEFSDSFQTMDMHQEALAKWEPTEDELDKLKVKESFQIQTTWMSATHELKAKYLKLQDFANEMIQRLSKEKEKERKANHHLRRKLTDCLHQLYIHQRKVSEKLNTEKEQHSYKEDLERAMVELGHMRSFNEQLQAGYNRIKDEKETATKAACYRKLKDNEILIRKKDVALKAAKARIEALVTENHNILNKAQMEASLKENRERLLFTLNTGAKFCRKQVGALSLEQKTTLERLLEMYCNASVRKATKKQTLSQSEEDVHRKKTRLFSEDSDLESSVDGVNALAINAKEEFVELTMSSPEKKTIRHANPKSVATPNSIDASNGGSVGVGVDNRGAQNMDVNSANIEEAGVRSVTSPNNVHAQPTNNKHEPAKLVDGTKYNVYTGDEAAGVDMQSSKAPNFEISVDVELYPMDKNTSWHFEDLRKLRMVKIDVTDKDVQPAKVAQSQTVGAEDKDMLSEKTFTLGEGIVLPAETTKSEIPPEDTMANIKNKIPPSVDVTETAQEEDMQPVSTTVINVQDKEKQLTNVGTSYRKDFTSACRLIKLEITKKLADDKVTEFSDKSTHHDISNKNVSPKDEKQAIPNSDARVGTGIVTEDRSGSESKARVSENTGSKESQRSPQMTKLDTKRKLQSSSLPNSDSDAEKKIGKGKSNWENSVFTSTNMESDRAVDEEIRKDTDSNTKKELDLEHKMLPFSFGSSDMEAGPAVNEEIYKDTVSNASTKEEQLGWDNDILPSHSENSDMEEKPIVGEIQKLCRGNRISPSIPKGSDDPVVSKVMLKEHSVAGFRKNRYKKKSSPVESKPDSYKVYPINMKGKRNRKRSVVSSSSKSLDAKLKPVTKNKVGSAINSKKRKRYRRISECSSSSARISELSSLSESRRIIELSSSSESLVEDSKRAPHRNKKKRKRKRGMPSRIYSSSSDIEAVENQENTGHSTTKRKPESHRMEEQKLQNNLKSPEKKSMRVEDTLEGVEIKKIDENILEKAEMEKVDKKITHERTGVFVDSLEDKSTDYELESKSRLSTSPDIETAENKDYSDQSTAKTKPCNEKSESHRSEEQQFTNTPNSSEKKAMRFEDRKTLEKVEVEEINGNTLEKTNKKSVENVCEQTTEKKAKGSVGLLEDALNGNEPKAKNRLSTSFDFEATENKEYTDQSTAEGKLFNEKTDSHRTEKRQFKNKPKSPEKIAARFEDMEILGEVEMEKIDDNILQKREMGKGDKKNTEERAERSVDSLEETLNYHEPESKSKNESDSQVDAPVFEKENTPANRNEISDDPENKLCGNPNVNDTEGSCTPHVAPVPTTSLNSHFLFRKSNYFRFFIGSNASQQRRSRKVRFIRSGPCSDSWYSATNPTPFFIKERLTRSGNKKASCLQSVESEELERKMKLRKQELYRKMNEEIFGTMEGEKQEVFESDIVKVEDIREAAVEENPVEENPSKDLTLVEMREEKVTDLQLETQDISAVYEEPEVLSNNSVYSKVKVTVPTSEKDKNSAIPESFEWAVVNREAAVEENPEEENPSKDLTLVEMREEKVTDLQSETQDISAVYEEPEVLSNNSVYSKVKVTVPTSEKDKNSAIPKSFERAVVKKADSLDESFEIIGDIVQDEDLTDSECESLKIAEIPHLSEMEKTKETNLTVGVSEDSLRELEDSVPNKKVVHSESAFLKAREVENNEDLTDSGTDTLKIPHLSEMENAKETNLTVGVSEDSIRKLEDSVPNEKVVKSEPAVMKAQEVECNKDLTDAGTYTLKIPLPLEIEKAKELTKLTAGISEDSLEDSVPDEKVVNSESAFIKAQEIECNEDMTGALTDTLKIQEEITAQKKSVDSLASSLNVKRLFHGQMQDCVTNTVLKTPETESSSIVDSVSPPSENRAHVPPMKHNSPTPVKVTPVRKQIPVAALNRTPIVTGERKVHNTRSRAKVLSTCKRSKTQSDEDNPVQPKIREERGAKKLKTKDRRGKDGKSDALLRKEELFGVDSSPDCTLKKRRRSSSTTSETEDTFNLRLKYGLEQNDSAIRNNSSIAPVKGTTLAPDGILAGQKVNQVASHIPVAIVSQPRRTPRVKSLGNKQQTISGSVGTKNCDTGVKRTLNPVSYMSTSPAKHKDVNTFEPKKPEERELNEFDTRLKEVAMAGSMRYMETTGKSPRKEERTRWKRYFITNKETEGLIIRDSLRSITEGNGPTKKQWEEIITGLSIYDSDQLATQISAHVKDLPCDSWTFSCLSTLPEELHRVLRCIDLLQEAPHLVQLSAKVLESFCDLLFGPQSSLQPNQITAITTFYPPLCIKNCERTGRILPFYDYNLEILHNRKLRNAHTANALRMSLVAYPDLFKENNSFSMVLHRVSRKMFYFNRFSDVTKFFDGGERLPDSRDLVKNLLSRPLHKCSILGILCLAEHEGSGWTHCHVMENLLLPMLQNPSPKLELLIKLLGKQNLDIDSTYVRLIDEVVDGHTSTHLDEPVERSARDAFSSLLHSLLSESS